MSRSPELDGATKRSLLTKAATDTRNRPSVYGKSDSQQRNSSEGRSDNYFREGVLFKDTGKHLNQVHSRFGSLGATLKKERRDVNDMVMEKQLEKDYRRYMQRQDKISRYFNQNFDEIPASSKFNVIKSTRDQLHHQRFTSSVVPIG